MSLDGERDDWVPTAAGQAVIRNNRPLLAYIGGKDKSAIRARTPAPFRDVLLSIARAAA